MEINPSEVTKILKEQIKNFGEKAEVHFKKFLGLSIRTSHNLQLMQISPSLPFFH